MSGPDPDDDGTAKTAKRAVHTPARVPGDEPFLEPTTVRPPTGEPFLERTTVRGRTSDTDPLIGAMLGEYRVLAPLGEGGIGLVYRGEQPVIGKPVAIKVLKREYAQDPVHVRRFLEEARSVSAARHPGIIDVFSFGQTAAGEPYLVMELLEGTPLDVHLRRMGALPAKDALALLIPILNALGAAHAAGVTHRDLKPGNIFVVKLHDGTTFPKLLDFGLARRGVAGSMVRQTSVGGTPLYIAPEQARGDAVGPQTDLYSVGCIAYELLVGEPPFTSANLSELIDAHLTLAPEPLRNRASDVPVELERLVLRLLTKDPAHRPASALDVREQLERIQANLIVSPTRPTSIPRGADVVPTRVHTVSHDTAENPAYVPASPRWPLALGALTVLSLTGLAAWRWWPTETPVVEAPRLPEPVVQPTEPPAVMPVAVEPGPKPEPIKEPPVVTPPVTARAPRHSGADVKKRWLELDQRSKTLEDDLRRSARLQLDQARHCTAPAEQCWRDLGEIEELFFRK